jgi:RimJ/RimL family protein N-acetyltransferase
MLNFPLPLETPRLILRNIVPEDKAAFSAVRFEYGVDNFIKARLAGQGKTPRTELGLAIVEKDQDIVLGYAELAVNELDDIELRAFIFPEYQFQGYAKEACMRLCAEAFNFEYEFLTATTLPQHESAHYLLKKLGMVLIGKNEAGEEYWSLERRDFLLAQKAYQTLRQRQLIAQS